MAIDYTPLYRGEIKYAQLAEGLSVEDLRAETHRLYDAVRDILSAAADADIAFEPLDTDADDPYAENPEEQRIGWSLGHLVAHITASNEEGAVFSAILAGGVALGGRIRHEVPWQQIDTVAKAVHRLEESRRMMLAYLDAWPDEPHLDVLRQFSSENARAYFGDINAPASYLTGLSHHNEHIPQVQKVLQQAQSVAAKA